MQIIPYLPQIGKKISENAVTVVSAPTGSGKSIGIPSTFGQSGYRVFISVPTVTAARSLANYQKMITDNVTVGFAAEGEVRYDEQTTIVYSTSGHLRRKLLTYFSDGQPKDIDFTDILIIDEAHSGSLDNSINIDLWKYAAQAGVSVPRLVLSSATIDLEPDTDEASGLNRLFAGILEPAIEKVNLARRGLLIKYHDSNYDLDETDIYAATAKVAAEFHNSTTPGDMLIFAPGANEVENLVSLLTQAKLENALILPAYGAMEMEQLAAIYNDPPPGMRKIIIATNVAESAITISNLGIVIDTMLEKRNEVSKSGGTRLALTHISQSSAKQRAGRTGRTRDGVCYRMMTEGKYETLEKQRPAEITRVPLYNVIMELMNAGLRPIDVLTDVSDERKLGQQIIDAVELLIYLGLLDSKTRIPTEAGRFVTNFPLSVQNATVLWKWKEKDLPMFPAIAVMSMIDCYGPSYLYYPRRQPDQTDADYRSSTDQHTKTYFEKFIGYSDIDTLINIWNDLMDYIGGPRGHSDKITKWSRENSMNNKKIREALNIVNQCQNECRRLFRRDDLKTPATRTPTKKNRCEDGPFTREGTLTHLRPILAEVYANTTMNLLKRGERVLYLHGGVGGYAGTPIRAIEYKLDSRVVMNNFAVKPPNFVVGLSMTELSTRTTPLHILSLSIDVQPQGFPRPKMTDPARTPRRAVPRQNPSAPMPSMPPSKDHSFKTQEAITGAFAILQAIKKQAPSK